MHFDPELFLFWLKKLSAAFILPPLLPLGMTAFGLLLLGRAPRLGRVLAWGGVCVGLALSAPQSVGLLLAPLEAPQAVDPLQARSARAIVILGGGRRSDAAEFGGDTVNRLTLERLRYGARLARETGLPILVSGGPPQGGVPEAALMQTSLREDFNLGARWVEGASRDTRDNARLSAAMLRAAGIDRILLVTHAVHMPRAQEEFEAQGLTVIAAPTAWLGRSPGAGDDGGFGLPSQNAAYAGWYALHEWMGLIAYRLSR